MGIVRALAAGVGAMRAGGSVVVTSSPAGSVTLPGMAAYSASKAALDMLVRTWALELGPRGIRVNAVLPGIVESEMAVASSAEVDLGIHLYLYGARRDVFGITHTHSPYATSFAVREEDIPAALAPLTHLIGSGVPCTRYATPGAQDTGAAIIESVGETGMAAVVARHGVFTLGRSASQSVEIALHVEEAAMTIRLAQQSGPVTPLDDAEIDRCFAWYRTNYGQ